MTAEYRIDSTQLAISRRRFLKVTTASGVGLWATACGLGSTPSSTSSTKAASGTANVFCSAGQRWELPQRGVLPLFQQKFPSITVNIQPVPHDEATTKVQVAMSSHTTQFDVVFTDYGDTPALQKIGSVTNLQSYLDRDSAWRDDYFADVPEAITRLYRVPADPKGAIYGLTADGNSQLNYYRKDIFAKLGINKVPETWPDVISAAQELTSKANNQYGFITTMQRGLFAGLQMWAFMASYGGKWFDKEEKGGWHPQFHTSAGASALETIKKLMPYAHPVTLNATDDQANQALAQGTAVYGPVEWGTSILTNPKFTKFADSFGVGTTPRGENSAGAHKPLMGGLGFFIPTWSKNKDAAWEWIKWCTSGNKTNPAIGKAWVENTGQPARVSLLKEYTKIQPYFEGLAAAFPTAIPSTPILPEAIALSIAVGNETTAAITGEKDSESALKAMDAAATSIMQKGGYYN
jgi:ABC-type glycerol-3-phosphate transport system substrate-binding protein